jgi:nitroimidazol reductase NimA-like FMN-containing flavoprotein (pyridoxamine 5'-phosphate oxidase superfamily)
LLPYPEIDKLTCFAKRYRFQLLRNRFKKFNLANTLFVLVKGTGDQMEEQGFIESSKEMEELLREEEVGYLGLSLDGKPYVVPLNYCYSEGKIYFHCKLLQGKKLDCLRGNPQVCFTVARQLVEVRAHAGGNPCHVDSDSVICYGRARMIEELDERNKALNAFNRRFRTNAEDVPLERVKNCGVVEIKISEMTGRRERERKRTCWRYAFPS